MKRLLIILIFFFISQHLIFSQINKQGIPFIKNYSPQQYNASEQNWAIVQDSRGVMYFGNNDKGILEYDGKNWRKIATSNKSSIVSLAIDSSSNIIYVGAVNEFGYLKPNKLGKLQYCSLSDKLDSVDRDFTTVDKTYCINNKVYFCSRTKIFQYDSLNLKNIYILKKNSFYSFAVDNKIYIGDYLKGLMEINNNKIKLSKGGDFFERKNIFSILPYGKNKLLVCTGGNGLFIYDVKSGETTSENISLQTNQILKESFLYDATYLNNNFVLSTIYAGCIVIDKKGNIINKFNKKINLQDESVISAYVKPNMPLWLALNSGISSIQINSPIRLFSEESGLKGNINDIIRYKGVLYVATSLGVFYLDYDNNIPVFKKIENISDQSWKFLKFNYQKNKSKLLVGTIKGIYEIKTDKSVTAVDENIVNIEKFYQKDLVFYCYSLYASKKHPSTILLGTNNGLVPLIFKNGLWTLLMKKFENTDYEIRSIDEDKQGDIWLGTSYNGVCKITFNTDNNYNITHYDTSTGLPTLETIFIYNFDNNLLFATPKGSYRFNNKTNTFYTDTIFYNGFIDSSGVFRCSKSAKGDYYMAVADDKSHWIEKFILNKNDRYSKEIVPFKSLPNLTTDAIYCDPDNENISWFGIYYELYCYNNNFKKNYYEKYYTLIRKVTLGEDSIVFYGTNYTIDKDTSLRVSLNQPDDLIPVLKFQNNDIRFQYAAPFFEKEQKTTYSSFLYGYEKEWSKWNSKTERVYTNLDEGEYIFKVKAKNIYGIESEEATYKFIILPPWYRTILAYIFYIIAFIVFVWFIVKLNVRRLEQEKIHLEGIVKERTAEVVKQRDHIAEQNKSITDSIHYASRIQRALLPGENIINKLPEHFVLFKPRDIVSGDFYWMSKKGDKLFIVAADCTGHGVPGAFMSMLGISFLNEIVNEKGVDFTNIILDDLREHVITSLKQAGESSQSKDGMDVAFCIIDKKTRKLQFSGANNPVYIIRELTPEQIKQAETQEIELPKGVMRNENYELTQIKPDKMPIGIYIKNTPFTYNEVQLIKDDSLYIFSDGYVDQFGGDKGSKFMTKRFKRLLLSVQDKPMEEQKEILDKNIEEWKGDDEQIDDILVIGFKV